MSSLIEYGYLKVHSLDIIKYNELFNELEGIDEPFKYFKVSITSYLERVTKDRAGGDKTD